MIELSVIIPAYNEEGNLAQLVDEIVAAFSGNGRPPAYEIIVVDDGSTDATAAEVERKLRRAPALRLLRHARRARKSAALKTGFDAARGGWIATLDGDGQNDPADLARLWPEIQSGPPNAIYAGVRRSRNDGAVKMFTSRVANPIRRWLLKDTARDTGCGFKVLPVALARTLPYFDNMHRFIPALARRQGYDVREAMVNDRPRRHGQSKYGFFDRLAVSFLDVIGVYWLIRRYSARGEITEMTAHLPMRQETRHQGLRT